MEVMEDSFKDEKGKWDLVKITRDCESMLKEAGIPIRDIVKIIEIRDSYIFGSVFVFHENDFGLHIAGAYSNPKYKLTEVRTVICHLLLHTVEDCMNHGGKWVEYAQKADRECGLHIMEHAAARPKAGENWNSVSTEVKAVSKKGRCCFLDYIEKLEEIMGECIEELKKIGLNIGHVSELRFEQTNVYGCCIGNDDFTILISERFAKEDADRYGLKHILCHELLHTCPEDDTTPGYGYVHGPKWREMARKVEKEYGYKLMSEGGEDLFRLVADDPKRILACPNCGGYYNVYDKDDEVESGSLTCVFCKKKQKLNLIKVEDMGILPTIYFMAGEYQDKMKIAGIPVGVISGIGFVSKDKPTGLHDNWDGSFSIDLPERFRKEELLNSDELKAYLYQELVRSCKGCNDYGEKWKEYMKKCREEIGYESFGK